ncbi:LysM peptidoglycan-binding domain-containing protein [Enterococcus sp. LJL128]
MKRKNKKIALWSLFSVGIVLFSGYLMESTPIMGSTPEEGVTASNEKTNATVSTSEADKGNSSDLADTSVAASESHEATAAIVPAPEETIPSTETGGTSELYKVKQGESLWEIAQNANISLQDLMNINQLSNSVILEGQELITEK